MEQPKPSKPVVYGKIMIVAGRTVYREFVEMPPEYEANGEEVRRRWVINGEDGN